MSGLALLCILPAKDVQGMEIADLSGPPHEDLTLSPLTLWTRRLPEPPAPTLENVRAHHGVVASAWAAYPAVLPVRFGQWFASSAALEAAVAPSVAAYAAALERVRGASEFSVRMLDLALVDPVDSEPSSGTAYLRAAAARARTRAEAEARGRALAAELRAALGPLAKDERVEPAATRAGLANLVHLVDRAREEEYGAAVDRFAAAHPRLRFQRTGPWPAWSFTA